MGLERLAVAASLRLEGDVCQEVPGANDVESELLRECMNDAKGSPEKSVVLSSVKAFVAVPS